MAVNNKCPRCYEGVLRSWAELSEDEQEIVKRLPYANDYETSERESNHRWCNRCWHEAVSSEEQI